MFRPKVIPSQLLRQTLFLLLVFACSTKAEASVYWPTEFSYYSSPISIELVTSAWQTSVFDSFAPKTPGLAISTFSPNQPDLAPSHRIALSVYNHLVQHQLKRLEHTPLPPPSVFRILKKQNISHQSSGEEPVCC
jgi:hypothetical protein